MKRQVLGLIVVLGAFGLACGLLDEEAATITYTEGIPIEFTIDANELCPEGEDICEEEGESPADTPTEPIDVVQEVDIAEATGEDGFRDITDRLRSLTITGIEYEITDNDLTFNIPDIELYVAPEGTEDPDDDDAIHLTTIPSTDAGTDVSPAEEAEVESEQAREDSSELFKKMEFAAMTQGEPQIEEGQEVPPSGDADVELTINIEAEANPTDEL